jgi:hypothetical protein
MTNHPSFDCICPDDDAPRPPNGAWDSLMSPQARRYWKSQSPQPPHHPRLLLASLPARPEGIPEHNHLRSSQGGGPQPSPRVAVANTGDPCPVSWRDVLHWHDGAPTLLSSIFDGGCKAINFPASACRTDAAQMSSSLPGPSTDKAATASGVQYIEQHLRQLKLPCDTPMDRGWGCCILASPKYHYLSLI